MALTERNRSAVYRGLSGIINEEAVSELLSNIPAHGIDEPATKDLVRAEAAQLRTEIATVRSEFANVHTEIAKVRTEASQMEQRLMSHVHSEARASTQWTIGVMVGLFGILIAALTVLG